ncbi:MAG: radical SAM protein [Candidatus Moraniibacteriota bacterium]
MENDYFFLTTERDVKTSLIICMRELLQNICGIKKRQGMLLANRMEDVYILSLGRKNYWFLDSLLSFLINMKARHIIVEIPREQDQIIKLKSLQPKLDRVIVKYGDQLQVIVKNFPVCIFQKNRNNIFWQDDGADYVRSSACDNCKYNYYCRGLTKQYAKNFGVNELKACLDLPDEVTIEVESKCNFSCSFCFNRLSFAKEGRGDVKTLSTDYVKKIIKRVREVGIKNIRFTGGEPLIRRDILNILDYAKSLDFSQVRLNTNASLIDRKMAGSLVKYVDNFLIPLESGREDTEARICGFKNAFSQKVKAIRILNEAGAKSIRIGTVATKAAIKDLENIEKIVSSLPIKIWELYRPISADDSESLKRSDLEILITKLSTMIRKERQRYYGLANALPFCSVNDHYLLNNMNDIASIDAGYNRFAIDPRGFAKPHYFIDENIGDPLDPIACWQHPFMKKMRNLDFLPGHCDNCHFKFKCRGGNRIAAKIISGSFNTSDPLTNASRCLFSKID